MKKFILNKIKAIVKVILKDPEIQNKIRSILQVAIHDALFHKSFDIKYGIQNEALRETSKFVLEEIPIHLNFNTKEELTKAVLNKVKNEGIYLEFGVYKGDSINLIADLINPKMIYGFDSFDGLKEPWHFSKEGLFKTDSLPIVRENVDLIVGFFEDTLPSFIDGKNNFDVAFLHIDSDLYSSCKTIFQQLAPYISSGTIILFDEFFNFPNWKNFEYKAWLEFIESNNFSFEYIGFCGSKSLDSRGGHQLALRIL